MPTHLPEFLTDEQLAIITADCEHTLITAVAGSGKTSTLAWRIRYLLEQGQDPDRMLVLMFNRSARADFQYKLREITRDSGLVLPEIRTYHAMGLRLYRRFIREGYLPGFAEAILTDQEISYQVWLQIRRLAPEALQEEIRRNKKDYVETAVSFIDLVKTTLSPAEVVFAELGYTERHAFLVDLFHGFEQWRKAESRISFADMLYEPVMAIHQNPPLQRLVANKMDLILVDEYQDTSEIQHLLLRYVAGDRARVTVVGDPDQTIYEFRGARPEFIISRFSQEFDSPRELALSYTFRYGHRIALLANHLISHNSGRAKTLCHAHPSTPASRVHRHEDSSDSSVILRLLEHQSATALRETAILFRVWSQSVPIELRLLARQVPYRIDAGKGALFSREVEAITSLLQVVAGTLPHTPEQDRFDLARQILRFPHVGLKEQELNQLARLLAASEDHWGQLLLDLDSSGLNPLPARKLRRLGETLQALAGFPGRVDEVVRRYADNTELFEGIRSLALSHEVADERISTIRGFQAYLAGLDVDAAEALEHLRTLRNQASTKNDGGLLLSTIHRTKGLEWSTVILPGLQEKYLPYTPRQGEEDRAFLESERRLLYVALTRTRDHLHLITRPPGYRAPADLDQAPSRFMDELCVELSNALGGALDEAPPGEPLAELTVSQPLTAISQRYAEWAELTLTSTAPTPAPQAEPPSVPVWSHRRLQHTLFGAGSVAGEDEGAFEVRFDSGRSLNFSKKSAHLYFTPAQ